MRTAPRFGTVDPFSRPLAASASLLPHLSHAIGKTHPGAVYGRRALKRLGWSARTTLKFYLTLMNVEIVGGKPFQEGLSPPNPKAQIDPRDSSLRHSDRIGATQAGCLRAASGRLLSEIPQANIDKAVKDLVTRICISGE
jgi:hypothetical protein